MQCRILAWIALVALLATGCLEQHSTLTVKADGSCEVAIDMRVPRAAAEQRLLRLAALEDEEEEEDEETNRPTSLTDEQLVAEARKRAKEGFYRGGTVTVDDVVLEDGKLRVRQRIAFPSLRELLLCGRLRRAITRVTYEKDEQGRLKITQWAVDDPLSMLRSARVAGFKGSFRTVLPGKILSSSLPEKKDNATWVSVDPADDNNYATLEKLLKEPVVIVAEMGDLPEEILPLDSRVLLEETLRREVEEHRPAEPPKPPATDAGPGFLVEAESVHTVIRYLFPEGAKLEKGERRDYGTDQEGVRVQAKLYVPRGRRLLETGSPNVLKAVDDRGRALPIPKGASHRGSSRSSGDVATSASLDLQFGLPEADAEFIREIKGEVIVTTFDSWRRQRFPGLKADPKKAFPLDAALPGAKLTITGVAHQGRRAGRHSEGSVAVRVEGPAAVNHLDFALGFPGVRETNSYIEQSSVTSAAGRTVRTLKVSYAYYGDKPLPANDTLVLTVSHPVGMRRERVKFVLRDLDLY
jgi:hypothetical protein